MTECALVVGATGLVGRATVARLAADGWQVVALARQQLDTAAMPGKVTAVAADVNDAAAVKRALARFTISHVFYCVHYSGTDDDNGWYPSSHFGMRQMTHLLTASRYVVPWLERWMPQEYYRLMSQRGRLAFVDENLRLFESCIAAVDTPALQQFVMVTGGRYYGHHLGDVYYSGYQNPFFEQDAPAPGPNWYHSLELRLQQRAQQRPWHWTILRPSTVVGFEPKAQFSMGPAMAVYASLLKAMNKPLYYPGSVRSYHVRNTYVSSNELARLISWCATTPAAHNQVFNAAPENGQSWRELWPQIADYFAMPYHNATQAFCLKTFFTGQEALWRQLCLEQQLAHYPLFDLMPPLHFSQTFCVEWDTLYSNQKLNEAGFTFAETPLQTLTGLFERLAADKVIPTCS